MKKNTVLMVVGLLIIALGAYSFARSFLSEPQPTFSTTYYKAGIPIPFPDSQAKAVANLAGHIHSFAISPDLKTIAVATSKGVVLYDLQSYERLRTLSSKENSFSVAFSPDGKKLAAGSLIMETDQAGIPHLVVWDTSAWEIVLEPKLGNGDTTMSFGALAWSPNGKFLATSDYGRGLVTFDVATGKVVSRQEDFIVSPFDISWSPDSSRMVATGDLGFGFRRWRVNNDKWVRLYDQRVDAPMQVAWSPDGQRIASGHGNGIVCLWTAKTNRCDGLIQAQGSFVSGLAWSPNGSQLATGGSILRIWDTQTGEMVTSFGLHPLDSVYTQLEWLSDGRLVSLETGYIEYETTIIRFWDINTGKILMKFVGAGGMYGE